MAKRIYPSARQRILDAAERVLIKAGLGGLSIDAVLVEAEISKGGFFHHFASRDQLLAELMKRLTEHVATRVSEGAGQTATPRGATLRSQISFAFDMPPREKNRMRALVLALMEAAKSSPAVATGASREVQRAVSAGLEEGVTEGNALLIQLALDGYWLGESIGTLSLNSRQKTALRNALLSLTQ